MSEVAREELDVVDMADARCDAMTAWAQQAEPWKPKDGERARERIVFSSFPGTCSQYARPECDSERRKDGRDVVFVLKEAELFSPVNGI